MAKSKDTTFLRTKMRKWILLGNRPTRAAILSGISRDTYQIWSRENKSFSTFVESCESELQAKLVKEMRKVSIDTKNANAMRDFLQVRFPEEFSPKVTNEITGPGGDSVVFKVDVSGGYIPPSNVMGLPSTLSLTRAKAKKLN